MRQDTTAEILNLLAGMKKRALTPEAKVRFDCQAVGIITQDMRPQVMADNLKHWLDLNLASAS